MKGPTLIFNLKLKWFLGINLRKNFNLSLILQQQKTKLFNVIYVLSNSVGFATLTFFSLDWSLGWGRCIFSRPGKCKNLRKGFISAQQNIVRCLYYPRIALCVNGYGESSSLLCFSQSNNDKSWNQQIR